MRYLILFFILSFSVSAQRISDFNVYNVKGTVAVRFSISPGPSCNGYKILHSVDSLFFNVIDDHGNEICGNYNTYDSKMYDHANPVGNMVNYYKVELQPYEVSQVRRVYVSAGNTSIIPYPNPVFNNEEQIRLRFMNVTNIRVVGTMYNQTGNPLRTYDVFMSGDSVFIPVGDLSNGLYIVWFTDGQQPFACKFIIQR